MSDINPIRIMRRVVQYPYAHTNDVFARVFARIDRCAAELATAVLSSESR